FIGEECTLALSARYILGHTPGKVVTNVSTGFMLDEVAAEFGCEVQRVPVGEVNVADRMIETHSVIGGEGNGGVICPAVNYSRDSLTGMALVLQFMLESGKQLSTLADELPRYTMLKKKIDCDRMTIMAVIKELQKTAQCDAIDDQDGFKLIWKDSWVHLRGSNTEPVLRIIAEARTAEKAEALIAEYQEFVSEIMAKKK
ncbi:MAG: phosphoglucosamine mutase, partial [Planctomycetes bacterium]|nr:phosphoglucosamine mutase [Planctomycetota bacterium]